MPVHSKKPKMMCAHGGPTHCDEGCYAEGGEVKGHGRLGVEFNPDLPHREGYPKSAKEQRDKLDAELKRTSEHYRRKPEDKSPEGKFADGGEISSGFNGALGSAGISSSIKNLTKKADGGEVNEMDEPVDDDEDGTEIHKMLGEELSHAIASKDHKGMHDSIEAIVENCLSKKGKK